MFRIRCIFVALVSVFVMYSAYAQCCDCDEYDGCALGDENIAGSGVECHPCSYMYNCDYCNWCDGFTDHCPSGVPGWSLCKIVTQNCGQVSGCTKYEICNPNNGVQGTFFVPSNVCHLESGICYPNERACSEFDVTVVGGSGDWTCKKEYQSGNAYWMDEEGLYSYWRVDNCSCNKSDLAVTTSGCAVGVVKHDLNSPTVPFATTPIPYTQTQRYCSKCVAGKIPQQTSTLSSGGVTFAPSSNSGWGSYSCKNVSKPKYSDDCTVRFDVGYTAAVAFCEKSCDSHMETKSDGATSADACLPDSTEYEDGIGKFTLGTDKCD